MKLEKFEIKSHQFRHPIEIQRNAPGKDEDNIPIVLKSTLFKTRAKIINNRSTEDQEEHSKNNTIRKTFYIRTRKGVIFNEQTDSVLYKGISYDIEDVNDIEERGIITELRCKLVK